MGKIIKTRGERRRAYIKKHDAETYANLAALAARRKLNGGGK